MNPQSLAEPIRKSDVLVEALPYIQSFRGCTFLVKVGGSAMEDPDLVRNLMRDIVLLEAVGINPVVVHGGGKAITQAMEAKGLKARWVDGIRVTDEETIQVVEETLSQVINPGLVRMIGEFGGKACGLSGRDVFRGRRICGRAADGSALDLGFVGEVAHCEVGPVLEAANNESVPVLSPVASEEGTGHPLNVNADIAAAALAKSIHAHKLIYLSDVLGLMRDPQDPATLVTTVDRAGINRLIEERVITRGMIPKMRSALDALSSGVAKVHLIDGRIHHSLLLEIFTTVGIGTEIVA